MSLRWESSEFVVFDDRRCHSPLHLIVMPTAWLIPDWTYLLVKPALALEIIQKMQQAVAIAAVSFLQHDEFRNAFFVTPENGWPAVIDAEWALPFLLENAIWAFRDPAYRRQLSLHVLLPPVFPWSYQKIMMDTPGTWLPLHTLELHLSKMPSSTDSDAGKRIAKECHEHMKSITLYNERNELLRKLQLRSSRWQDVFTGMANNENVAFTIENTGSFALLDESADDIR